MTACLASNKHVGELIYSFFSGMGEFSCISELARVRGEIEGVRISDIDCRCDTVLAVSDTGELFGWGNSEYGQFDMITQQPQIASPTHLPVNDVCGQVKGVTAAATKCALVNGEIMTVLFIF